MRYAASLAIAATTMAAGLTVLAVQALGPGAEAHPVTRIAAGHLGWIGYLTLSIVAIGLGLRLLVALPFGEWGVRTVALAKTVDALRDAWLVAHHPAVHAGTIDEALPAVLALVAAAAIALLIVRGRPTPRQHVEPEIAV